MIYVLTYNFPHRKTQDLLYKLKLRGNDNITLLSTPWKVRDNFVPLIPHRNFPAEEIYPKQLANRLQIEYKELQTYEEVVPLLNKEDWILLGGAGIIPKSLTDTGQVINAHPGYLPYMRGLDALKWAIYDGQPIGVTTHIISADIDLGMMIQRKLVPIYYWDTFHSVAQRQYEMEIDILVDSINNLDVENLIPVVNTEQIHLPIVKKRMPHSCELRLIQKFNKRIENI